jgi:hypothetical protein
MISCVFIQTNESMLEGQEFICTSKMVCTTSAGFKHPNSGVKKGTIHSVSLLSFKYYYATKKFIELLVEKMKRRES